MINFKKLSIPGVVLIEPHIFNDERGFFFESFNKKEFEQAIGYELSFVQDNHSRSSKSVLRGLHYQSNPFEQGKLVRVISGEIYDVAVDIRPDSKYFGQWVGVSLSSDKKNQLWIPKGFAHGFCVVSEFADVSYKASGYYSKVNEVSIKWDDPIIGIKWPVDNPLLSEKDKQGINLSDI